MNSPLIIATTLGCEDCINAAPPRRSPGTA